MTSWVGRLIVANIIVFFLQQTAVPQLTAVLAFQPQFVLMRPWTIVTYMFLHAGFGHIFFNMLALYFFGRRVEERLGPDRFIILYFLSGIAGAALSFLFAFHAAIIGASGAVFGVMLAFAYFWPRDEIYIWGILPIQARWLVAITTLLALWSGLLGSPSGMADFAHLGGFAGAFLYLRWIGSAPARFKAKIAPKVDRSSLANWKRIDPQKAHEVNRGELNRILDKISATGLGSLTPQERQFLSNFVPPDDRVPPVS